MTIIYNCSILTGVDIEELIDRIEAKRKARLFTQAELARRAGISRQRVNAVLRGRSRSLTTIRAMRDALGLMNHDPGTRRGNATR